VSFPPFFSFGIGFYESGLMLMVGKVEEYKGSNAGELYACSSWDEYVP
jgi:hypothetical protein